jgi:hypothetical protein
MWVPELPQARTAAEYSNPAIVPEMGSVALDNSGVLLLLGEEFSYQDVSSQCVKPVSSSAYRMW